MSFVVVGMVLMPKCKMSLSDYNGEVQKYVIEIKQQQQKQPVCWAQEFPLYVTGKATLIVAVIKIFYSNSIEMKILQLFLMLLFEKEEDSQIHFYAIFLVTHLNAIFGLLFLIY